MSDTANALYAMVALRTSSVVSFNGADRSKCGLSEASPASMLAFASSGEGWGNVSPGSILPSGIDSCVVSILMVVDELSRCNGV